MIFAILFFLFSSFESKPRPSAHFSSSVKDTTTKNLVFGELRYYPEIRDEKSFIDTLCRNLKLERISEFAKERGEAEQITYYKKVQLFGSDKFYYLIEYDYKDGAGADYPWKYQLLFDESMKFVDRFVAESFELVMVFPKQALFILTQFQTHKGNGTYQLWYIKNDQLESAFDGYDVNGKFLRTIKMGSDGGYSFGPKNIPHSFCG